MMEFRSLGTADSGFRLLGKRLFFRNDSPTRMLGLPVVFKMLASFLSPHLPKANDIPCLINNGMYLAKSAFIEGVATIVTEL